MERIDKDKLPRHVAVIMDGNGRWAKQRGKERIFGHENGVEAVRQTVKAARELNIPYLTFFAFSTENWCRPPLEVDTLMELLVKAIREETPELNEKGVRLLAIGNLDELPAPCRAQLDEAIRLTAGNSHLNVCVALSYSSRWEIAHTARILATKVQEGLLRPEDIDQELFGAHLQTSHIPEPDLLIRTSGELRLSNFLLWQIAYSELYFTPVYWPDFRRKHFLQAVIDFQRRERRFGKIQEQLP